MGQIKPYLSQVQPSGPTGVQRANPSDMGAGVGQAMQGFGQSVENLGDAINQREVQKDVSDVNAKMAVAHAELTTDLLHDLQTGQLDTDKFKAKVQERMDQVGDNVSTTHGREAFNVMSAQLQGHFLERAAAGQAELASTKAVADFQTSVEARSSALENDPTSFNVSKDQQAQAIQSMVASGGLPAEKAPLLQKAAETELAKSAIYGLAKLSPEEATHQLDKGVWDSYLNGDNKRRMYNEVRQVQNQQLIDSERAKKAQRDAADAKQEAFVSGFLGQVHGDGPGPKASDVLNALKQGSIDSTTAEHLWKILDAENSDKKLRSDPYVFSDLTRRLSLPDGADGKITDDSEIKQHLGKDLSIPDANLLYGLLSEKKTPQGEADAAIQKAYFDLQRGRTVKKDPLGMEDPEGLRIYQDVESKSFQYALDSRKNGKSNMQIWSPTIGGKDNPDYVGNHVFAPVRTMQDKIKSQMEFMKQKSQPADTVPMKDDQGKIFYIPKKNVDEAIRRGAKKVE